jgi:hypothetical protein
LGLSVAYTSTISTNGQARPGAMGGWDQKRGEVQVLSRLTAQEKLFVLTHELTHAELALGYLDEAEAAGLKTVDEMEAVVHCASESLLCEVGLGEAYREFCDENARWYLPLTELRASEPLLASLSEAVSQGMAYELRMDGESFLDA